MLKVHMTVPNMEPLIFALRTPIHDFSQGVSDDGLWPQIVAELQETLAELWATQGASGADGQWKELDEKYAKWKARKYPGATILQRRGGLEASFMGGPGFHFQFGPLWMEFGSDLAVGLYHQTGTQHMPARRIFQLTEEQQRRLRSVCVRWIQAQYRALGFRIVSAGAAMSENPLRRISRAEASAAGRDYFAGGGSPI